MATQQSFVDYVAEQSQLEQRLSFKRMFGEYAVYLDGKVVAFACDNSLFIKPSAETAHLTAELPQRPPYPGAKDYPVADQLLDEGGARADRVDVPGCDLELGHGSRCSHALSALRAADCRLPIPIRKRPPLRGHGARADQAFVTQGTLRTPGNRGKPRVGAGSGCYLGMPS